MHFFTFASFLIPERLRDSLSLSPVPPPLGGPLLMETRFPTTAPCLPACQRGVTHKDTGVCEDPVPQQKAYSWSHGQGSGLLSRSALIESLNWGPRTLLTDFLSHLGWKGLIFLSKNGCSAASIFRADIHDVSSSPKCTPGRKGPSIPLVRNPAQGSSEALHCCQVQHPCRVAPAPE